MAVEGGAVAAGVSQFFWECVAEGVDVGESECGIAVEMADAIEDAAGPGVVGPSVDSIVGSTARGLWMTG